MKYKDNPPMFKITKCLQTWNLHAHSNKSMNQQSEHWRTAEKNQKHGPRDGISDCRTREILQDKNASIKSDKHDIKMMKC